MTGDKEYPWPVEKAIQYGVALSIWATIKGLRLTLGLRRRRLQLKRWWQRR